MTGEGIFYPESPAAILAGTIERLRAMGVFKNVYDRRTMPTKDDQLPLAAVFEVRDETEADGDENVSSPQFFHRYTLAIDLMVSGGSESDLNANMTALSRQVQAALLTDAGWVELFEGIEKFSRHPVYPKETNLFLAQAAIEVLVTFRSMWPPYVPDDFSRVAVRAPMSPDTSFITAFEIPQDPQ